MGHMKLGELTVFRENLYLILLIGFYTSEGRIS